MLDSLIATLTAFFTSFVSVVQIMLSGLAASLTAFLVEELPKILAAVVILGLANYLSRKVSRLVERTLGRSKAEAQVTKLLANLARWAVIAVGLVASLSLFTDVSSLIATLGLVGFAVTFAFQDVLANLVSGIIIMVQHPFKVGESVSLNGFEGTVVAVSSRSTEIACFDGRLVLVPNGNSIGNAIINYSRSPTRRVELPMRLTYESDLETIRAAILEAIQGVPGYLKEPAPMVIFDSFGELSLGLTVYFWVDMSKLDGLLTAKDRGMQLIARALSERGVSMPVHVQSRVMQVSQP
jgi:small conductance mechanosensitive channel